MNTKTVQCDVINKSVTITFEPKSIISTRPENYGQPIETKTFRQCTHFPECAIRDIWACPFTS